MSLFLIMLLLAGGFTASDLHSPDQFPNTTILYNDTCDYLPTTNNSYQDRVRCGDQCIDSRSNCTCGFLTFNPFYDDPPRYCCIQTNESCTTKPENGHTNAVCGTGDALPMTSHCDNADRSLQCHNSYQDSMIIGKLSYYTCPHTCVDAARDLCRGVNWCESDVQECGPHLRCSIEDSKTRLNSILAPNHHFCNMVIRNNLEYDIITRSDEDLPGPIESTSYDIDPDLFSACNDSDNNPGVMCGESSCLTQQNETYSWCHSSATDSQTCNGVTTRDRRLCGNPLVFSKVPCTKYLTDGTGRVEYFGMRCTGTNQECVIPWYTMSDPTPNNHHTRSCRQDKSDRIFNKTLTCREHLQQHMAFHDEHFCNSDYWLQFDLICTNKTQWLSEVTKEDASFSNPHNCQSSCSSPGLDCLACTNPDY